MPACSQARNPRGYEIRFTEDTHTYFSPVSGTLANYDAVIANGGDMIKVEYTSGTSLIHHYFPKFDADGSIAKRKAQERGCTADQIRFEWKQNAKEACDMGTRVHETCEDILHGRRDLLGNWEFRNKPLSPKEKKLMSAGFQACTKFVLPKMNVLGVEKIVFDYDCQLAGTIDLLAQDKNTGVVWILDWKTNKRIDEHNTFTKDKYGLAPIEHLENCNFIHYALQLNLYQWLMLKAGYFPHGTQFKRAIIHLTEEGPKPYVLPDLQLEVANIVVDFLQCPLTQPDDKSEVRE